MLPQSLWKFYFKYALRDRWFWATAYVLFFFGAMSEAVLFPNFQRWFISLFEQTPPAGVGFIQYALPTIFLIVGLLVFLDACVTMRALARARWQPIAAQQIAAALTDYVHTQSMSFWTGRMSGKINSQIGYIEKGLASFENMLQILGSVIVIIINVGLILNVNSYVAIVFACVFVFRLVYGVALMRPMKTAAKDASSASSTLSGKQVDSISNYSVVKLFAGTKTEHEYLSGVRKKMSWPRFIICLSSVCFGQCLILCGMLRLVLRYSCACGCSCAVKLLCLK